MSLVRWREHPWTDQEMRRGTRARWLVEFRPVWKHPGSILGSILGGSTGQEESLNIATRILVGMNANNSPYANQENLDL